MQSYVPVVLLASVVLIDIVPGVGVAYFPVVLIVPVVIVLIWSQIHLIFLIFRRLGRLELMPTVTF